MPAAHLQRAVKAGYKDTAHMKKDTDLDPLRDCEDFRKLQAELEAGRGHTRRPSPDEVDRSSFVNMVKYNDVHILGGAEKK